MIKASLSGQVTQQVFDPTIKGWRLVIEMGAPPLFSKCDKSNYMSASKCDIKVPHVTYKYKVRDNKHNIKIIKYNRCLKRIYNKQDTILK